MAFVILLTSLTMASEKFTCRVMCQFFCQCMSEWFTHIVHSCFRVRSTLPR